ncbi:hypothetical protein WG68_00155 [Arsukibacterium ikkense]|uniref:Uncharacterized protein n=1 Tax=Arsukibacterium ikkense TaxID=336831 RepID=A0A0M2V9L5_9GAMM|nr:hypothetical protein [Arsukibacterium ikkense]KKO47109.1 hypothetical protein WG68_00155 [Arsukibacterium ikkense]
MNTYADRIQKSKSQSAASGISSKIGAGESSLKFVDNRPEAIAQRKLQAMANNRPQTKQTGQLHPFDADSVVVQRIINVDGRDYGPDDKEAFEQRYDERHRAGMLPVFLDFPYAPRTIADALADQRHIYLKFEEDDPEYGVSYNGVASALVTDVGGGKQRVAGEIPELILKPAVGFEQMDITGLIMCIGIVIEAQKDNVVEAASGGHFVTPSAMEESALNGRGVGQLASLINLAKPHGTLSATLCHAASAEKIDTSKKSTSMSAMTAINAIVSFLLSNGVSKVNILQTGSKISYKLDSNGNRSFE